MRPTLPGPWRQTGTSVAGEVPIVQQSWSNTSPGDAIQMIALAEKDMCPSELTAQTVTYTVTGTPGASVTYGPSGTNLTGSVPMAVRAPLGTPFYYPINAQLQGEGEVKRQIKVDGVTISSASASGERRGCPTLAHANTVSSLDMIASASGTLSSSLAFVFCLRAAAYGPLTSTGVCRRRGQSLPSWILSRCVPLKGPARFTPLA